MKIEVSVKAVLISLAIIAQLAGSGYVFLIARAANLIAQSELRYLDTVETRLTALGQPLQQQPQAAPAQKEKK